MTQIKSLTFDIGDMKEAARKALESCMAYITAYDNTDNEFEAKQAAISFGKAMVWLDMLADIGIEYAEQDEHISSMIEIADTFGLSD